ADHRRSHHDDLAEITRVGEGLLIAGEVRREHNLTERRVDTATGQSREPCAVLEQNESGAIRHPVTPQSIAITASSSRQKAFRLIWLAASGVPRRVPSNPSAGAPPGAPPPAGGAPPG